MITIGITGTTGAGKTTALHELEKLGGCIIDADAVYHQLLASDLDLRKELEDRFGPMTDGEGNFQRKKLGAIVFADPEAMQDLNAITHTAVRQEVITRLQSVLPAVPVAIDAIELFDGGLAEICDTTVAVTAPEEDRILRLIARDGLTREQALLRIRAQKPEAYFREICSYTLENSSTQEDFRKKCLAFFQKLSIIKEKP